MIDMHGQEADTAATEAPEMTTPTLNRDVRAPKTNKAGRYRETSEFLGFIRRGLRALVRRVGDEQDIEALSPMLELHRQLEDSITGAVAGLRRAGYSWAEIGQRAGMTKQGAQQRWGRAVAQFEALRAEAGTFTAQNAATTDQTPAPAAEVAPVNLEALASIGS